MTGKEKVHLLKVDLPTWVEWGKSDDENAAVVMESIETGQDRKGRDFLRFKLRQKWLDRGDWWFEVELYNENARLFARECARLLESSSGSTDETDGAVFADPATWEYK